MDWATKGRKDIENKEDTYYSRFVKDILRAIAQCRGSVEAALSQIDPKKWLSLGPGKVLGHDWSEEAENRIATVGILGEEEKVDSDTIPMKVLELDDEMIQSVEEELKKAKVNNN